MRCPYCAHADTRVRDSRAVEDGGSIRRRRICDGCEGRFTTFERVQLRELTIVKNTGRRVPFDRDKLAKSVRVALRKRPIDDDAVERMISGVVRTLESAGEIDVSARRVGELVMEGLRRLDQVAYVRFASVYRNFREAKDFGHFIEEMSGREERAPSSDGDES